MSPPLPTALAHNWKNGFVSPACEYLKYGNGAGTRNRTADLLITNQSLYQLSYPGMGDRT